MLFTTSTIALVALLPLTLAAPLQKRAIGATIQSGRTGNCLSLPLGSAPGDGTLLTTLPCAQATKFDINFGSGSVIVTGTNYALDAGVPQGNNMAAKVWTSYPGSPQQTWYLTNDNRIAITGGNQCLDQGDLGPQTYQCTTGNTNQVWFVSGGGAAPVTTTAATTTTAVTTTAVTTTAVTTTAVTTTAATTTTAVTPSGKPITWKSDTTKCLSANGPFDGAVVTLRDCATAPNKGFVNTGSGQIQLAGTTFCLDGQSNPANGGQMQIWTCNANPQQVFQDIGAGLIRTANNQCIDIDNANTVHVQTWACSSSDPQQMFNYF